MKQYKHIFFDLDRTLWDFERNSYETIHDLFYSLGIDRMTNVQVEAFIKTYKLKNAALWDEYRNGLISKNELREQRFSQALMACDIDDSKLGLEFNDQYVQMCSSKPNLVANAMEVLQYLKPKYTLHIITNGFVEAQGVKIKNSGLEKFFDVVVISDGLGFKKPDKRIFYHALKLANANQKESIMIGDDYGPDVIGAKEIGMDQVYFTQSLKGNETATHVISDLIELKTIL